ncbi:hypothetical protein PENARI_c137G07958 [Penicillium arizonense]|uniref:Poly(A) RNA polymerase mitochondrial-like central palm domain-containing protein n=1 Tax=Penicillium arizonense TaxID=1835702 RepID=A0A1F5L0X6_PENAI|nr:hypothetical protein PENARI_c137G07958 [Penicillium arizonense]OGE46687.1 hypothetical protein PENARI_c137G07958 [Penicillium arizonense]
MDTSDDASDTERLCKKRAMEAQGWSNPDPYTALPPPSQQMDNSFDIVKLIRKARLDNAAKVEETDELKENLDFVSFGMTSESEPQSNAPRTPPTSPPKGQHARKTGNAASKYDYDGSVISERRPLSQELGTPWLDHEIVSFYDWAKPQEIENIVRRDLVERLDTAFQNRYGGIEIHGFGSFGSGIYLSTADIDLVLLSDTFRRTGAKKVADTSDADSRVTFPEPEVSHQTSFNVLALVEELTKPLAR